MRDQEFKELKKGISKISLASKKVLIPPEWLRPSHGECGSLTWCGWEAGLQILILHVSNTLGICENWALNTNCHFLGNCDQFQAAKSW